jgi:hypothetical protein
MIIECILLSVSLCRAVHDKPVVALGLSQSAVLVADGVTTRDRVGLGYTETDPVTRLFLGRRPTWGAMAPLGTLQSILEMWLAERMRTSRNKWMRRLWWVPQSVGITGNAWGVQQNSRNLRTGP